MNRFLLVFGGLLVGILAALFVVPAFVDWNRYRGTFEEEATRLLGRDVRVGGKVNLRLLPTPYIQFERVRIADTKGGVGEALFRADDLTIWLAVGPLFSGALEASEIELKRPMVTLVLDQQGSGNWSDLASARPSSVFLPSSVALNAVRITNGTVALISPGGTERLKIEHINGELAAASLTGPFKINAAFAYNGAPRDIRLSTAAPEADGSVRFKGTVRAPETGAAYALDGHMRDVLQKIKLDGELKISVPLARMAGTSAPANPAEGGDGALDIRSMFKADTETLELSDIALSFEQAGRPQLASGSARLTWRQQTDLDLLLSSKWLDLDRIAGADDKSLPLATLARLARAMGRGITVGGRMSVRLDLEQASLGGEVVSGLAVAIEHQGSALKLVSLAASLPGNSHISASGELKPEEPGALFEGPVTLRGASFARMLAWGARGLDLAPSGHDGSFLATGHVRLGEGAFVGRSLAVQVGTHRLVGEVAWTGGAERKLTLALDGTEFDVTPLVGRDVRPLSALRTAVDALATARSGTTPEPARAIAAMQARLRIGKLVAGQTVLNDVAAEIALADGNLSLTTLRVGIGEQGLIEVKGDIAGLATNGARGSVSGRIVAETPAQFAAIAALLELPEELIPGLERAKDLAPLRLAGRIGVGEKGPQIYDIQLDGQTRENRVTGTIVLDRKRAHWRETNWDAAVTVEGSSAPSLLRQLLPTALQPAAPPVPQAAPVTRPAAGTDRVLWRAIGTPKDGLATLLALDVAGLALEYRGQVKVSDAAGLSLGGVLYLSAADIGRSLATAGYRPRPALDGIPAAATLSITGADARHEITLTSLLLADTRVAGSVRIDAAHAETRLTGRLSTSRLSLPYLLRLAAIAEKDDLAGTRASMPESVWPAGSLDLSPLAALDVTLAIDAETLLLAPSLPAGKSATELIVRGGDAKLAVRSAAALGGNLTGEIDLARIAAGARLKARLALAGGQLQVIAGAAPIPPKGRFDVKLELDGAGIGPQAIVAALTGKGELSLSETSLPGLAPSAPRVATENLLALHGELAEGEVRRQVEVALDAGPLPVSPRRIGLEIADGIVRVAPVEADLKEARVTGSTSIDVQSLRFDSEWRLVAKIAPGSPEARRPPLPPIAVILTGSLIRLPALERRLQLDAFEREITVRKYERDVEELERIRREDEERAKQEAERRRLLDEQREIPVRPEVRPDPAQRPQEPQKQTILVPLPIPALPRLSLIAPEPPPEDRLRQPAPAVPATVAIPASAPGVAEPAPPVTSPRKAPSARAPRPTRDVLRDIGFGSP